MLIVQIGAISPDTQHPRGFLAAAPFGRLPHWANDSHGGRFAPERRRRRNELTAMSCSNALLKNIVLAWNTSQMHEVVEWLTRDGSRVEDEGRRRIGPAYLSHINFYGTMRFGVEKAAEDLERRGHAYPARVASLGWRHPAAMRWIRCSLPY